MRHVRAGVDAGHTVSTATEALDAYDAGLCVIRAHIDGSKAPVGEWAPFQQERPTREQVVAWFEDGYPGMGIVCGATSGGLEMFELEGRAVRDGVLEQFKAKVREAGLREEWERIFTGYSERTPSGGIHVLWRCEEVEPNQPLARRLTPEGKIEVLIETRGEGGFTITAPSNGKTHPSGGAWERLCGEWGSITTISPEVRRQILAIAASLDQLPEPEPYAPKATTAAIGDRPGDEFEEGHDCHDVLAAAGFALHSVTRHGPNAGTHYTRPGKPVREGSSATVYDQSRHDGQSRCTLYSSTINVPVEFLGARSLTPWQLHVAFKFSGDFAEAARAWRRDHPRKVDGLVLKAPTGVDAKLNGSGATDAGRTVVTTPLTAIRLRRVRWLWDRRLALGTVSLLAGKEGLGKSTASVTIAAQVTRGELPGEYHGTPKSVLVAAAEDSFEHTIAPRFLAAGADLARVHRIEVRDGELVEHLSLPQDIDGVEGVAEELDAALLVLDPLVSRLSSQLDTHKDAEVRQALEPLAALANRSGLSVWGLMHFNKTGSTDPLQRVMASKAFTGVARSVSTVIEDPDDDTGLRRYIGTPKNNLGPSNLPSLGFVIESFAYDTDDGPGETGRLVWLAENRESISDLMSRGAEDKTNRQQTIIKWLRSYFNEHGESPAAEVLEAAKALSFSERATQRAGGQLGVVKRREGFGSEGVWFWRLDGPNA